MCTRRCIAAVPDGHFPVTILKSMVSSRTELRSFSVSMRRTRRIRTVALAYAVVATSNVGAQSTAARTTTTVAKAVREPSLETLPLLENVASFSSLGLSLHRGVAVFAATKEGPRNDSSEIVLFRSADRRASAGLRTLDPAFPKPIDNLCGEILVFWSRLTPRDPVATNSELGIWFARFSNGRWGAAQQIPSTQHALWSDGRTLPFRLDACRVAIGLSSPDPQTGLWVHRLAIVDRVGVTLSEISRTNNPSLSVAPVDEKRLMAVLSNRVVEPGRISGARIEVLESDDRGASWNRKQSHELQKDETVQDLSLFGDADRRWVASSTTSRTSKDVVKWTLFSMNDISSELREHSSGTTLPKSARSWLFAPQCMVPSMLETGDRERNGSVPVHLHRWEQETWRRERLFSQQSVRRILVRDDASKHVLLLKSHLGPSVSQLSLGHIVACR